MSSLLKHARNRKSNNNKKDQLKPGTYLSTLVEITPAPGYREGDAYIFRYSLTDNDTGETYEKKETFYINEKNERFLNLLESVEEHGVVIEDIDDLLGLHEEVVLRKEVHNNVPFVNIYDRKFIDFLPVKGCDC